MRRREGGVSRGNATTSRHNNRMSGRHNKRIRRGDVATSRHNERTRGQCNERTTRGNATTSWRVKTARGRRNERRHNLIVVWLQTESIGEVAAMVVARIDRKPEGLCVGDESQHLSDVVQNGLRTLRHRKDMPAKMEHPFVRVSGFRMPQQEQILAGKASGSSRAMRTIQSRNGQLRN